MPNRPAAIAVICDELQASDLALGSEKHYLAPANHAVRLIRFKPFNEIAADIKQPHALGNYLKNRNQLCQWGALIFGNRELRVLSSAFECRATRSPERAVNFAKWHN